MPIDRAATLRNAEKLLRQGKLEPAIAEYLRLVEEQPRDWNAANTLGDLYVRAGHIDKAVEQFIRIADSLNEEGFLPKAAAIYKKILKLKPDHEHALFQAAEIGASQGLYADARTNLSIVVELRKARGDSRGAAQARIMLASLDPSDYASRMDAASARVEVGDTEGAVRDLKEIAAGFTESGRNPEAVEALRQASLLRPDDESIRTQLFDVYVLSEDYTGAREAASSKPQLVWLAGTLEEIGRADEGLEALRDAVRLDPDDAELRARLARALVARGDTAAAAEYLTVETAGNDPQLLLIAGEMLLRSGKIDEGLAVAKRLLEENLARADQVEQMGLNVAPIAPDAGFKIIELVAGALIATSDWASAARALQELVTRVPNHIPALLSLVEICVDGGLEGTMVGAQAQLADAYIAAGMADEARCIAEELVAREPYETSNIDRFRSALVLLGEPDPDSVIAERLSGQSPFMSTDLNADGELPPLSTKPLSVSASTPGAAAPLTGAPPSAAAGPSPVAAAAVPAPPPSTPPASSNVPEADPADWAAAIDPESGGTFELNAAIDIESVLAGLESDMTSPAPAATDVDEVFTQLRDEAGRRLALEEAETDYRLGLEKREAGDIDGCIEAFTSASRAPALRFVTGSLLGRIYRDRGIMPQAIEWFECAAQAPAPAQDDYHALLFDLADALEATGEVARALAVCLELQADAGPYRDVDARVDRLAKVQARG